MGGLAGGVRDPPGRWFKSAPRCQLFGSFLCWVEVFLGFVFFGGVRRVFLVCFCVVPLLSSCCFARGVGLAGFWGCFWGLAAFSCVPLFLVGVVGALRSVG